MTARPAARNDALLAQLRDLQAARNSQGGAAPDLAHPLAPGVEPGGAFDFATLDLARQLTLQEAAAASLGLNSPYFRLQEGPAAPETSIDGRVCLSFASYDYLGLNAHPELAAAAARAIAAYGVSATASRLVGGERPPHRALETALARFLGTEDAVVMVSGHATNVTTLATLLGPGDLILTDQLCHSSMTVGAQLSGAARLSFPHNDYDWLDQRLDACRGQYRHVLIGVEGLYSMDGDSPDLARLVEIKRRHRSWLMVDEAHALGVLGATGRGLAEETGVAPGEVEIWMGTLSKALGSCGGFIAGSRVLVRLLKYAAPGFVFSVGLAPALAAAAEAALAILAREPERVARLQQNGQIFLAAARAQGLDTGRSAGVAITPVLVGSSLTAVALSNRLLEAGISALPIIHPAVPEREARLRVFVTAEHRPEQLAQAAETIAALLAEIRADAQPTGG